VGRWRHRARGLTIVVAAMAVLAAARGDPPREGALVVRGHDGSVLVAIALPSDARFTLRYRNSVYRSTAEEQFTVTDEGRIRLSGLSADELAVLEEYYGIAEPASGPFVAPGRSWRATPPVEVEEAVLIVAATDLGRRTLIVEGAPPVELWRLVDDDAPWVSIEPAR
jgi:hypothetical protein